MPKQEFSPKCSYWQYTRRFTNSLECPIIEQKEVWLMCTPCWVECSWKSAEEQSFGLVNPPSAPPLFLDPRTTNSSRTLLSRSKPVIFAKSCKRRTWLASLTPSSIRSREQNYGCIGYILLWIRYSVVITQVSCHCGIVASALCSTIDNVSKIPWQNGKGPNTYISNHTFIVRVNEGFALLISLSQLLLTE